MAPNPTVCIHKVSRDDYFAHTNIVCFVSSGRADSVDRGGIEWGPNTCDGIWEGFDDNA